VTSHFPEKRVYSTFEVAEIIGVSPPTVIKWANDGKLAAFRTPGGHRRISYESLLKFVENYNYPLPLPQVGSKSTDSNRILILDFDRDYCLMVKELLEEEGDYKVLIAEDTFSLGLLVGLHCPSLVLLDSSLPEIEFLQIIRKTKRIQKLKRVKFLGLHSNVDFHAPAAADLDANFSKTSPLLYFLEVVRELVSE
jgi:excisionase family DNA binding protein